MSRQANPFNPLHFAAMELLSTQAKEAVAASYARAGIRGVVPTTAILINTEGLSDEATQHPYSPGERIPMTFNNSAINRRVEEFVSQHAFLPLSEPQPVEFQHGDSAEDINSEDYVVGAVFLKASETQAIPIEYIQRQVLYGMFLSMLHCQPNTTYTLRTPVMQSSHIGLHASFKIRKECNVAPALTPQQNKAP